jgi:hypothetical protein
VESLLLSNRAILMGQKERLEIDDFFPQGSNLGAQGIVLGREDLNLILEVGKPLLLALSALECGDSVIIS